MHLKDQRAHAGFLDEVHVYPAKLQADAGLIGAALFVQEIAG